MSSNLDELEAMRLPGAAGSGRMPGRLWRSRELIFTLVKRDLKVRYKSSSLGFFWSLGRPFLLMLVMWAVFSAMVRIPSSHPMLPYVLHLLAALLPWMFMSGAVADSLYSVLGNGNVIKKVWLPVEVFPASIVLGQLLHFLLAMGVLMVFVAGYALVGTIPAGEPGAGSRLGWLIVPNWEIILAVPLLFLMALLAFAMALILSSLNVFYRDVGSIAEIGLTAWFYLTPVIYPANFAREELQDKGLRLLYLLWLCNPMTPIVLAWRRILFGRLFDGAPEVSDQTLALGLTISSVTTAALLLFGMWLFGRMSRRFADEL